MSIKETKLQAAIQDEIELSQFYELILDLFRGPNGEATLNPILAASEKQLIIRLLKSDTVHEDFSVKLYTLLLSQITDSKTLQDIALAAFNSPFYHGEPTELLDSANVPETRILLCIEKIQDPNIICTLISKALTRSDNGITILRLLTKRLLTFSNPHALSAACLAIIKMLDKTPSVFENEHKLTVGLECLGNLIHDVQFDDKSLSCKAFVTIRKQYILLLQNIPIPIKNSPVDLCVDILQYLRINKIFPQVSAFELTQDELVQFAADLLSSVNYTDRKDEFYIKNILYEVLGKIPDKHSLFKAVMKNMETQDCDVYKRFLNSYIDSLNPLNPKELLKHISFACVKAKASNNTQLVDSWCRLNLKISLCVTDHDIENLINNIDINHNAAEVMSIVESLVYLKHPLYPTAVLSLAEYFYKKSKDLKGEEEQKEMLANAVKLIFQAEPTDYVNAAKANILAAYLCCYFPSESNRLIMSTYHELLEFLEIDTTLEPNCIFAILKNAIQFKQATIQHKHEMSALRQQLQALTEQRSQTTTVMPMPAVAATPVVAKKTPPPPPPLTTPTVLLSANAVRIHTAKPYDAVNTVLDLIEIMKTQFLSNMKHEMKSNDESMQTILLMTKDAQQFTNSNIEAIIAKLEEPLTIELPQEDIAPLKKKMEICKTAYTTLLESKKAKPLEKN